MPSENNSFYVLLGMLMAGPKSGYDIRRRIELEIGLYYKISNGQIYPTLKNLTLLGLATLAVEKNDGKPDRKVYSITDKGRDVFKEWLRRPVDYQNPGGNEMLLKLHFGALADIGHSVGLISGHRKNQEELYKSYLQIKETYFAGKLDDPQMLFSYLTLLHGLELTQAGMRWCDEALDMLNKADPSKD